MKTAAAPASKSKAISKDRILYRYSQVEEGDVNEEEMTLQVAFSSEYPVERLANRQDEKWGVAKAGEKYLEVLSHDAEDADLTALNNEGALLDQHDRQAQLGVVKRAEISDDRKGRAVVQFDGVTDLSKTRFQQMKKRSRPHISFGYVTTRFLGEIDLDDGRKAKRFAWAADEISSVHAPADPTVGSLRTATTRADKAHCTKCGEEYSREKLDPDFRCEGCGPAARELHDANFKVRAKDGGEVSWLDLFSMVSAAVKSDARFTDKGDKEYAYGPYVMDVISDGDTWKAVVEAANGKYYEVTFTFTNSKASLGEAIEVARKTSYEPVAGAEVRSAGGSPQGAPVDRVDFSNADAIAQRLKPDVKMKLRSLLLDPAPGGAAGGGAATLDEPRIRANEREKVLGEQKTRGEKIATRNKEIRALADAYVKEAGQNWAGKPGEVVVVGERIRVFEQEAYNAPEDHSDSEVRNDFKHKCSELIRGSRAPKNQVEAASLPNELASRCSLRVIYNAAAKAQERGERVGCFMPKDGAEFEADKELRRSAMEFPGGLAIGMEGVCLPVNMPGYRMRQSAREIRKMTRDALAGDFPTAGALVAPEFKFPTIELLRNKMALGRAGITILGGVIGNLVLPRQTGATVSQSVAEGAALVAYDQVFDQIRMVPHRIGSKQNYSRLALLQTTEDFEALVMNDHMAQNALRADYLLLNGAGANDEPLGIMNQIGIGVVAFNGSASAAYRNCVALETAIRRANIDEEPTFITTSSARGTLRITPAVLTGSTVVSGETNALWVGEELIGRPAVDSQQVPGDVLVAVVGRHVVMAQWGGWQVVLDTLTLADQDKIRLSMNTYIDGALRHPQAVSRSADSVANLA